MRIQKMALCALFTALLSLCAWLAIPLGDGFVTMQTFGIFLCLFLLGGKYGSVAIGVYLLLGAVGLPVFSGFRGGMGALLGATGGYIWGFGLSGPVYWLITALAGDRPATRLLGACLGLALCYSMGSLWYLQVYLTGTGMTLGAVLLKCVVPYLIPDAIKLFAAYTLSGRIKKYL